MSEDLISRQAALDALGEEPEVWVEKDQYAIGLNNQWNSDRDAILAVPSEEPRWIPVECKPPKERNHYWVCTDTGYQCECRWTNNVYGLGDSDEWGWSIFDIPHYTKVVAYMPLPEPYRMEGDDNHEG